ncbi:Alpha/beta hydrolase fold-1 [Dendryphion nanum]|uniref:Alpha/beta hydrolase fold-1 n=1 Tax=Dendryphion nanum TaxID=256645 RepID=A0A9P9DR46_9PLEO|nr:Alpha/beta hydrolase fold-1 [Dendryphion nanum]
MATITSKLQHEGYTVYARQMPSVGNSTPDKGLHKDITAACDLVSEAIGEGNDVVVVAHSWGGVVAGSALAGLGKKERTAEGKKGGVIKTAYMAAFILPEGVSLMDAIQHGVREWQDIDQPYAPATGPGLIYNDLSEAEQQYWQSQLQTQDMATFHAKTTAASWQNIPTSYLLCENDMAIPAELQERMALSVKEAGAEIEVTRLESGHSPFLSKPDETVEWLRKVAGEKL